MAAGAIFCHKTSRAVRFCVTAAAARGGELQPYRKRRCSASAAPTQQESCHERFKTAMRRGGAGIGAAGVIGAALPALAGEDNVTAGRSGRSKQANIGGVTGLAVGAAAGGPIGAVVGAHRRRGRSAITTTASSRRAAALQCQPGEERNGARAADAQRRPSLMPRWRGHRSHDARSGRRCGRPTSSASMSAFAPTMTRCRCRRCRRC